MNHLVISDPHVTSGQNLERFSLLNRLIRDIKPKVIICLGDFATLDSCSSHEKPGTRGWARLPSLQDEAVAVRRAQTIMFSGLKYTPKTHMICGNHEDRYDRWLSANPKQAEAMVPLSVLLEYTHRWQSVIPFKAHEIIDGIAYTHVPHTTMGRPLGGKTKTRRAADECRHPLIFGHGHDLSVSTGGDILGGGAKRFAMSAPAFMDHGNVEEYAKGNHTGWAYGVLTVSPHPGSIPGFSFISMLDLQREYR